MSRKWGQQELWTAVNKAHVANQERRANVKRVEDLQTGDVMRHGKMWREVVAVYIDDEHVALRFSTGPDLLCMKGTEKVIR